MGQFPGIAIVRRGKVLSLGKEENALLQFRSRGDVRGCNVRGAQTSNDFSFFAQENREKS